MWVEVLMISAISIACIFLLSQRTGMLLGFIVLISIVSSAAKKKALLPLVVFSIGTVFIYQYVGRGEILEHFPAQLNRMFVYFDGGSDASLEGRTSAWKYGIAAFVDNPFGHGLGSFPSYFSGINYPHNVLIEALFELGFFGGVCIAILCVISVKWMLDAATVGSFGIEEFILLVGFLYAIKAGDFQTIGPWFFGLYLVAGKNNLPNTGDELDGEKNGRRPPLFPELTGSGRKARFF